MISGAGGAGKAPPSVSGEGFVGPAFAVFFCFEEFCAYAVPIGNTSNVLEKRAKTSRASVIRANEEQTGKSDLSRLPFRPIVLKILGMPRIVAAAETAYQVKSFE